MMLAMVHISRKNGHDLEVAGLTAIRIKDRVFYAGFYSQSELSGHLNLTHKEDGQLQILHFVIWNSNWKLEMGSDQ